MSRFNQQNRDPAQQSQGRPPNPATAEQPSFRTNVNRAKTKRWVEAKSYSYDGDDWGEVDDYDEYGGYPEPEPEPVPRNTGLRQRGQSASQTAAPRYDNPPEQYGPPVEGDRRGPGGVPEHSSVQQQKHGPPITTDGVPAMSLIQTSTSPNVTPSAQQRAFPSNVNQSYNSQSSNSQSAYSQSTQGGQILQQRQPSQTSQEAWLQRPEPQVGLSPSGYTASPVDFQGQSSIDHQVQPYGQNLPPGTHHRGVSSSSQPPQFGGNSRTGPNSRAQSMTNSNSSAELQNRRDFSPSAVPNPLQSRTTPSPQHTGDGQIGFRPPRKTSLGQQSQPIGEPSAQSTSYEEVDTGRQRTASNTGKALPFVRPADIYRRMQEEKEKEQRSQESSRRSMDTANVDPSGQTATPAPSGEVLQIPQGGHRAPLTTTYHDTDDDEAVRNPTNTLDPVPERQSEYGFERFSLPAQGPQTGQQGPRPSIEVPHDRSHSNMLGASGTSSGTPLLPDVTRMSGFGESFLTSADGGRQHSRNTSDELATPQNIAFPIVERPDSSSLQRQHSLGFKSVVNQAFDQVPPTPSSSDDSNFGRSNTQSTSSVSPVMSRAPSAADQATKEREAEARDADIPMIPEEPSESNSRPGSSSTLGTPQTVARKHALPRPESAESSRPPIIPGHRRNIHTPSPDNSPARTPALDLHRSSLNEAQQAQLTMTSPTGPSVDGHSKPLPSETGESNRSYPDARTSNIDAFRGRSAAPHISNTESPNRGRVKEMAVKFQADKLPSSIYSQGNKSQSSLSSGSSMVPPRPIGGDRSESFRPHLPGGWESYSSNTLRETDASTKPMSQSSGLRSATSAPTGNNEAQEKGRENMLENSDTNDIDINPTTIRRSLSKVTEGKDISSAPFSAAAAAGTALAGALAAAVGMDHKEKEASIPEKDTTTNTADARDFNTARGRSASILDRNYPEAAKPFRPSFQDGDASSVAPTPLEKNSTESMEESPSNVNYFPPTLPLKQKLRIDNVSISEPDPHDRPAVLPSMSTETSPQDYESDRLRKELVRELSPSATSAPRPPPTGGEGLTEQTPRLRDHHHEDQLGHDSTHLPSEYDSYWSGLDEGDTNATPHEVAFIPQQMKPLPLEQPAKQEVGGAMIPPPQPLTHRFSWELDSEDIEPPVRDVLATEPTSTEPAAIDQTATGSKILMGKSGGPGSGPIEKSKLLSVDGPSEDAGATSIDDSPQVEGADPDKTESDQRIGLSQFQTHEDAGSFPDVAPEAYDSTLPDFQSAKFRDENSRSLEQPVQLPINFSSTPPEPLSTYIDSSVTLHNDRTQVEDAPLHTLPPKSPIGQARIPAFREILMLKTPDERVRAYDGAREQFARMDSGLSNWILLTSNDLPEHAGLIKSRGQHGEVRGHHKPSPSRNKIPGLRIPSVQTPQQPYYQQYLNASNESPSSPASAIQDTQGSSPQGHNISPGGNGKTTSHQVQAKGKDLLHTAGVFGGKANVAAKGLFSKGKSKFRGSGGGEKGLSSKFTTPSHDPSIRATQQAARLQPHSGETSRDSSLKPSTLQETSSTSVSPTPLSDPATVVANMYHTDPSLDRPLPAVPALAGQSQSEQRREEDHNHEPSWNEEAPNSQSGPASQPDSFQGIQRFSFQDRSRAAGSPVGREILSPVLDTKPSSDLEVNELQPELKASETIAAAPNSRSCEERPAETAPPVLSPQPVSSSNRTPTQADFDGILQQSATEVPILPLVTRSTSTEMANFSSPAYSKRFSNVSNLSGSLADSSNTSSSIINKSSNAHTAGNQAVTERKLSNKPMTRDNSNQSADTSVQGSRLASETPSHMTSRSLMSTSNTQVFTASAPQPTSTDISRPFSFIEYDKERHDGYSDVSALRPNVDAGPPRSSQEKSISPVSPQQSTSAQLQSTGPIYHDPSHDFVQQPLDHNTFDRRPRSYSRPFQDRSPSRDRQTSIDLEQVRSPSQDRQSRGYSSPAPWGTQGPQVQDRPLQAFPHSQDRQAQVYSSPTISSSHDPNLANHPAFRNDQPQDQMEPGGQYYPANIRREEAMLPRQQATEYQLEGVGPPAENASSSKSRSRRGSRSSTFFKTLSSSPRSSAAPPIPPPKEENHNSRPVVSPTIERPPLESKKSRTGKLFRSLTGDNRRDSNEGPTMPPQRSGTDLMEYEQSQAAARNVVPSALKSKKSWKLQRNQSTNPESGKKNRFSSLGSIFGRSGSKLSPVERRQPIEEDEPVVPRRQNSGDPEENLKYQDSAYNAMRQAYVQPQRRRSTSRGRSTSPLPSLAQPPLAGYYAPPPPMKVRSPSPGNLHRRQEEEGYSTQQAPSFPSNQYVPDARYLNGPVSNGPLPAHSPSGPRNSGSRSPSPSVSPSRPRFYRHHSPVTSSSRVNQHDQPLSPTPPRASREYATHPDYPISPSQQRVEQLMRSRSPSQQRVDQSMTARSRSPSPLPPPPPPKDTWITPHPSAAYPRPNNSQSQSRSQPQHVRAASHSALGHTASNIGQGQWGQPYRPRPSVSPQRPNQNRQSLPPLRTNMSPTSAGSHFAAASTSASGLNERAIKTSTPEEIRRARREEIERSGMPQCSGGRGNGNAGGLGGDVRMEEPEEQVVMSATSFPGQEWHPGGGGWFGE